MNRDTLKRVIAILLLGSLVLGLLPLAALAAEANETAGGKASVGIIGGADGPTAIFVTGNWGGLVAILAAVICSGVAVVVALRKRRK